MRIKWQDGMYKPNMNFQFCCITNSSISMACSTKHLFSSSSVGWLGAGQGLAGVALPCSMWPLSSGLSWACSPPGMAGCEKAKGSTHTSRGIISEWARRHLCLILLTKESHWLNLNGKSRKLFFTPLAKKIKVPRQKVQIVGGREGVELGLTIQSTPWICIRICGSQARYSRVCLWEKKKLLMWRSLNTMKGGWGRGAVDSARVMTLVLSRGKTDPYQKPGIQELIFSSLAKLLQSTKNSVEVCKVQRGWRLGHLLQAPLGIGRREKGKEVYLGEPNRSLLSRVKSFQSFVQS